MFWGLIMEPQRRYTQKVKKGFHISMASLDISTSSDEPAQIMCGFEGRNYLLCTLKKPDLVQCALDLNFEEGTEVSFASNGKCHIHLTGYLTDDPLLEELEEEESDTQEEETKEVDRESKKRNKKDLENEPPKKKSKTNVVSTTQDDEDDSDSDDSDFDLGEMLKKELKNEEDSDLDGEEDDDEEDDDDDDKEEADDSDVSSLSVEEEEEDGEEQEDESEEEVFVKKNAKMNGVAKKQDTPKKQESPKKKNLKEDKETPKKKEDKKKAGKTPQKENEKQKKVLQGGVMVEDIREGHGPVAKNGKFINVYYEGRLKTNNKIFDSTSNGAGFKFRLGGNEVIKAWDIGLAGMKVGGKRRIICPPQMAYGQKGSPPAIPPNSTLIFDVELKRVH